MKYRRIWLGMAAIACMVGVQLGAQKRPASDGLGTSLGTLSRLSHAKTRSIASHARHPAGVPTNPLCDHKYNSLAFRSGPR
jgi:hypothetical protein